MRAVLLSCKPTVIQRLIVTSRIIGSNGGVVVPPCTHSFDYRWKSTTTTTTTTTPTSVENEDLDCFSTFGIEVSKCVCTVPYARQDYVSFHLIDIPSIMEMKQIKKRMFLVTKFVF